MTPARVISISTGRGAGSSIGGLGDRRLTRLAANGDPRAFAAIYERYHQDIFRYCRSITGNAEDASDALQSTMAAALRSLPGERRTIALRAWLFRIAHNESVSILRRRSSYVELTESVEPSAPGPYAAAAMRERLSGLVADLQALPERQRGALVMRELIGLDYDEIAVALNVSNGAARQAVYEARVALSQSNEGREMECEAARRSLSASDGRVRRARRLRAHLRGCSGCAAFSEQLGARRSALPAIFPPLPAAAGIAILGGLVGGAATLGAGSSIGALGTAGSGGVMSIIASGVSQAVGASTAAKGAAAAVAVAVVAGVGTVEVAKMEAPQSPRERAAVERATERPRAAMSVPARRASTRTAPRRTAPRAPVVPPVAAQPVSDRPVPVRRAPRKRQLPAAPKLAPVSDPTPGDPAPAAPTPSPSPSPAPAPAAPATPAPWQQQYTQAMQQAQLGLQVGQQVYDGAIRLTQQIVNGIFPLAPRK